MKRKLLLAAIAATITAGSLVGCNSMEQGADEVMPSPAASAPASAVQDSKAPSSTADAGMDTTQKPAPTMAPNADN